MNFKKRLECLQMIDLVKVFGYDEQKGQNINSIKSLAFQLVQTIAQLDGIELYSKNAICEFDPRFKPFIYRDENFLKNSKNLQLLNEYRDLLVKKLSNVNVVKKDRLSLFYYSPNKDKMNLFQIQCNGIVIDMGNERCIARGFDHLLTISNPIEGIVEVISAKLFDSLNFFTISKYQNELIFSTNTGFGGIDLQSIICKSTIDPLLDDNTYFYIFCIKDSKLYLVAVRNQFSSSFLEYKDTVVIAEKTKLPVLQRKLISFKNIYEPSIVFHNGKMFRYL